MRVRYPKESAAVCDPDCSCVLADTPASHATGRYIDRHQIDYIVHGDDPCFTPDGRDVYARVAAIGMRVTRDDALARVSRAMQHTTHHMTFHAQVRTR